MTGRLGSCKICTFTYVLRSYNTVLPLLDFNKCWISSSLVQEIDLLGAKNKKCVFIQFPTHVCEGRVCN